MFRPVRWLRSSLRSDVTLLSFFLYLAAALLSICFLVHLNASQAFIFSNVIGVDTSRLGEATGSLALYDELLSLAAVLAWGVLSDRIGRRIVYTLGFLIIGVATIVFPFASNLYPQLLLARLLFAIGAASTSTMLTAVLADFARDANRGFISGAVGLASGLGAIIALFVFLRLPVSLEKSVADPIAATRVSYAIVGGISILFCVPLWFFLKPKSHVSSTNSTEEARQPHDTSDARDFLDTPEGNEGVIAVEAVEDVEVVEAKKAVEAIETENGKSLGVVGDEGDIDKRSGSASTEKAAQIENISEEAARVIGENESDKKGYITLAKEGILAARNPLVALGYIGGFVARADSISLTLFITLYVNRHFVEKRVCDVFDPNIPNGAVKKLCPASFSRASLLSGTAQTCALVGALFFAVLSDRIPWEISLAMASAAGFAGFLLFSIVDEAESPISIVAVVFMGIGQIGMIVVSLALVTISHVPADIRGSVAGVYSFSGAIGILLSGRLGGALFDSWREVAPFILLAIFHAISFILSIAAWLLSCFRGNKSSASDCTNA